MENYNNLICAVKYFVLYMTTVYTFSVILNLKTHRQMIVMFGIFGIVISVSKKVVYYTIYGILGFLMFCFSIGYIKTLIISELSIT